MQYTPGPAFFANGGGESTSAWPSATSQPEKCYEGARLIAKAIVGARSR